MASPADVLGRISNLIQRGASDIAGTRITGAQLGLQGAKQAFEMDRYRKYGEPAEMLAADKAKQEMAERNRAFNLGNFRAGMKELEWGHFVTGVTPGLETTFDATLSDTGGLISNKTGQPITDGEMGNYPGTFQAVIAAVTDDKKRFEDLAAQGDPGPLEDYKKDPVKYLNRRKSAILAGIGEAQAKGISTTVLEKGLSDVEGQMTAHTKAEAEKAKEVRTQEDALKRIEATGKQTRLTKKTKGYQKPATQTETIEYPKGSGQYSRVLINKDTGELIKVLGKAKPGKGAKGALKPSDYKSGIQTILSYYKGSDDQMARWMHDLQEVDVEKNPDEAMAIMAKIIETSYDRLQDRAAQGDEIPRLHLQQLEELHTNMMTQLGVATSLGGGAKKAPRIVINRQTGERMYEDLERGEWVPIGQ
jgi:hypothetical protein